MYNGSRVKLLNQAYYVQKDAEYGILAKELIILVKTKTVQNNVRVLSMKRKKERTGNNHKRIKHCKMLQLENLVSDYLFSFVLLKQVNIYKCL